MFLLISTALFCVFISNVALGAFGGQQFLGDVSEMLSLLVTLFIAYMLAISTVLLPDIYK